MSEETSPNVKDILADLTPRSQVFAIALADGMGVLEAYRKAGYTGEEHAAYVLKGRLDKEISSLLEARGLGRADWLQELKHLNDMPLVDYRGNPVKGITVDHKLKIMAMKQKDLESRKPSTPTVRFNVNIGATENVSPVPGFPGKIIEAEIPGKE